MSELDPTPVGDLEYWLSHYNPRRDRWIDEQFPIDHPFPTGEAGLAVPAAAGEDAISPAAQDIPRGERGAACGAAPREVGPAPAEVGPTLPD